MRPSNALQTDGPLCGPLLIFGKHPEFGVFTLHFNGLHKQLALLVDWKLLLVLRIVKSQRPFALDFDWELAGMIPLDKYFHQKLDDL